MDINQEDGEYRRRWLAERRQRLDEEIARRKAAGTWGQPKPPVEYTPEEVERLATVHQEYLEHQKRQDRSHRWMVFWVVAGTLLAILAFEEWPKLLRYLLGG